MEGVIIYYVAQTSHAPVIYIYNLTHNWKCVQAKLWLLAIYKNTTSL